MGNISNRIVCLLEHSLVKNTDLPLFLVGLGGLVGCVSDQVADSIPTGSGKIFRGLIMKYFLWSFSPPR